MASDNLQTAKKLHQARQKMAHARDCAVVAANDGDLAARHARLLTADQADKEVSRLSAMMDYGSKRRLAVEEAEMPPAPTFRAETIRNPTNHPITHCGYIETQQRTYWDNPLPYGRKNWDLGKDGSDNRIVYGARFKAEVIDPAEQHYHRNLKEWPVCNFGGEVKVRHDGGIGRDIAVFGLRCEHCRKRLMPGVDRG